MGWYGLSALGGEHGGQARAEPHLRPIALVRPGPGGDPTAPSTCSALLSDFSASHRRAVSVSPARVRATAPK